MILLKVLEQREVLLRDNPEYEFSHMEFFWASAGDFMKNEVSILLHYKLKNMNKKLVNMNDAINRINTEMRNPALIHKIQDKLISIEGEGGIIDAIKKMAKSSPDSASRFVMQAHNENPQEVEEIVGFSTIKDICEYLGIQEIPFDGGQSPNFEQPKSSHLQGIRMDIETEKSKLKLSGEMKTIQMEKKSFLTEEELKKLDEEDSDDPDRRYHR